MNINEFNKKYLYHFMDKKHQLGDYNIDQQTKSDPQISTFLDTRNSIFKSHTLYHPQEFHLTHNSETRIPLFPLFLIIPNCKQT